MRSRNKYAGDGRPFSVSDVHGDGCVCYECKPPKVQPARPLSDAEMGALMRLAKNIAKGKAE